MEKTQEKKYLKWYHKVGYGSGDIAGNCVYQLLTSFVMIYLTDTVGLSMGIIGTLIALSKVFDGVTDFFFGRFLLFVFLHASYHPFCVLNISA